ncbi:MAG: DUF6161 domain-containing protein [Gammaproteobacteria bacterium]|nr:DUF6161 domain-containing protein [Gammaproteobacteria bacterium]
MNRQIKVIIEDVSGKSWEFEKLRTLLTFLEKEASYWKKQHESLHARDGAGQREIHGLIRNYTGLENAVNSIKHHGENDDWDQGRLEREIQNSLNQIGNWLWSSHPYSEVFAQCHREHGATTASAFIAYVLSKDVSNIQNGAWFYGVMLAYEFLRQDSDIIKRRKAEKISIGQLRNQLAKTSNSLIDEVEGFKDDFNSWNDETRQEWETRQKKIQGDFDEYMDGCKKEIMGLKETYEEKLRLAGPAEYWRKTAEKFDRQGRNGLFALISFLLLGTGLLAWFYINWLVGREMAVQLNTLQGIVIFGTILAVYAFLIRTLSRLTFSAFHLMRDAEEKEQLTYLYLSLINEKKIDETSRDIVLQALFSRSETGLLAGDSGPTMPGLGEMTNPNKI